MLSSVYYAAVTPLEAKALGDTALDRGRAVPWKVLMELARTAVVAAAFAWIATQAHLLALLTGSVIWERVPAVTATVHAGDWLLKLLLVAAVLSLLH